MYHIIYSSGTGISVRTYVTAGAAAGAVVQKTMKKKGVMFLIL